MSTFIYTLRGDIDLEAISRQLGTEFGLQPSISGGLLVGARGNVRFRDYGEPFNQYEMTVVMNGWEKPEDVKPKLNKIVEPYLLKR